MSSTETSPTLVKLSSTSPTSRVYLRSPHSTDAVNLFTRAKDPLCNTYVPFLQSDKCTLEGTYSTIKQWRKESYISSLILVIVNKANDTVIGDTGFQSLDFSTNFGELGIMIDSDPAIRGNGYAVEILDIMFSFAFNNLGLETVSFYTRGENIPMRTVLKKKFKLQEKFREEKGDWVYVADRYWWLNRRENGVIVDVVKEELTL
ncbi:acyl-CoA N-acyltransferase [Cyathus striatus]|nr:acyl-CoA N-acyltransferase [Cyathus striatus]KAF9002320.1 acyl-CoA N-acyltransferase [Cyathus striatus]